MRHWLTPAGIDCLPCGGARFVVIFRVYVTSGWAQYCRVGICVCSFIILVLRREVLPKSVLRSLFASIALPARPHLHWDCGFWVGFRDELPSPTPVRETVDWARALPL